MDKHKQTLRTKRGEGLQADSGVALIAVLWILLLLSIMATGYASSTRLRAVAAANQIEAIKNRYHEKSALERGRFEYAKYVRNRTLMLQQEKIETLTGQPVLLWYPRYDPYLLETDHGTMAIQVRYTDNRFNINMIPADLWDRVLRLCGLEEQEQRTQLRDALLDWVDVDNLHHLEGAESEYYLEQMPEYYCKNNEFQVLDELLLVRGVTPDLYYGNEDHPGLVDFLSVYGAVDKVDINCASPALFLLLEGLDDNELLELLTLRQKTPFQKLSELSELVAPDTYTQLKRYFKIVQPPADISVAVSKWPTVTGPAGWNHKIYRVQ